MPAKEEEIARMVGHLAGQFERALPVLFIGSGFSLAAKNIAGGRIPSVNDLRHLLFTECFGEAPPNDDSFKDTLQDLFQIAQTRLGTRLREILDKQFTVDTASIPDWYELIFNLPWQRIYTLNIDNLSTAANRRFDLPRIIKAYSAVSASHSIPSELYSTELTQIHLNGRLQDGPNGVTFSMYQYAERLNQDEPTYLQLVNDLLTKPVVFIGTTLDEPPLWQYIERRRRRARRTEEELRPKSYLITPTLTKARELCLQDFNVSLLTLTTEEFAKSVAAKLTSSSIKGHEFLEEFANKGAGNSDEHLSEISELVKGPTRSSDFLTGAEPDWSDLLSDRAIQRKIDLELQQIADSAISAKGAKPLLIITGTAGTGKSTALKRLGLQLSTSGKRVAWIDSFSDISPRSIRMDMQNPKGPPILIIDDADVYGGELSSMCRELAFSETHPFIILGITSNRVDRVIHNTILHDVQVVERTVPGLEDVEIDSLLDLLERQNRLGVMSSMALIERKQTFKNKCGRQLLVAMIEATSGRPFEVKIREEFDGLDTDSQKLYALLSIITASNFYSTKNELLMAFGNPSNETLNLLEQLTKRGIISRFGSDYFRSRHRRIAESVFALLASQGRCRELIQLIAISSAAQLSPRTMGYPRPRRMLIKFINHEFLKSTVGSEDARFILSNLEPYLSHDYNYWLHRGSLDVEDGNLDKAEQYLGRARALNPFDMNIQTEYAYLLMRKALTNPSSSNAPEWLEEGCTILRQNIGRRGAKDAHSYHILGHNLLDWIKGVITDRANRLVMLENLREEMNEATERHPRNETLRALRRRIENAYLDEAVAT